MSQFKYVLPVTVLCLLFNNLLSAASVLGESPRLYVIDRLVADEIGTINGVTAADKLVYLPETGNPLSLIADELKNMTYSEVHLFLLTKPGSLIFDELNILAENVDDCAPLFAEWKKYLSPDTKIIIHSDTLTSVPEGQILVEKISVLTGAEVLVQN